MYSSHKTYCLNRISKFILLQKSIKNVNKTYFLSGKWSFWLPEWSFWRFISSQCLYFLRIKTFIYLVIEHRAFYLLQIIIYYYCPLLSSTIAESSPLLLVPQPQVAFDVAFSLEKMVFSHFDFYIVVFLDWFAVPSHTRWQWVL